MTILTSIILIAAIVVIALFVAYNMQRGTKAMSEFKADFDNNPEVQAQVDMFKELYNKDLRPVVAKKAPKKVKEVKEVETIAEVVVPEPTPVQVETVVEEVKKETKSEFPIDKPKKKRKYYPRKPKTTK
jgi:hypothetical protein